MLATKGYGSLDIGLVHEFKQQDTCLPNRAPSMWRDTGPEAEK